MVDVETPEAAREVVASPAIIKTTKEMVAIIKTGVPNIAPYLTALLKNFVTAISDMVVTPGTV